MSKPNEPGMELEKVDDVAVPAVVETSASAVAAREKAAVEARFVMALNRPRSFDQARQSILAACRRPRFAAKVQYAKPIGKSKVHGLSIRFAEEAARAWGNIDVAAVVVFDDAERRIYRVSATDLETNATQHQDVAIEKFVERRSTRKGDEIIGSRINSQGEKVYKKVATEDEVLVKSNAACSKAKRNVILMLIPSDLREEAEETALETVRDEDAQDPDAARKRLLDAFYVLGVSADQVQALIGKPLEQLNPGDLNLLRQIHNGLKDGEVTWAEVEADEGVSRLREKQKEEKQSKGTAGLKDALGAKSKGDPKEDSPKEQVAQMELTEEQKDEKRIQEDEARMKTEAKK